ncbi:uncharacterized protein VTP21DRAFT_4546 [Calcarisporiella thermophila]|uniref:uncharacterized protein n=1 Tax=Calcarisporiella thermophila TaxID=911321 RepID=UPI0037433B65
MSRFSIYLVSSVAAIGGLLFGYDIGVVSGVLTMAHFKATFPGGPTFKGAIVSSLMAGCFLGALFTALFVDRIGRRYSLCIGALVFLLGGALQASATDFAQLYTGRSISGLSVGLFSVVVPLYQSEIAPRILRGRVVTLYQLAITIGISLSYWLNYFFSELPDNRQWRIPLSIQCIPAILLAIATMFLPDSPRWLVNKNRDAEAMRVLRLLMANAAEANQEYIQIKQNVRFEHTYVSDSYRTMFRKGPENLRRRMVLGVCLQVFQQLTGINSVMFFAPEIYRNIGFRTDSLALFATGISGIVNIVFTLPTFYLVDRWGRRPTLISGALLMCVSMAVVSGLLGSHSELRDTPAENTEATLLLDSPASEYASIIMLYLFVASFAYSWSTVTWLIPAEIFPQRIRGKANSVTSAANWAANWAIGQLSPLLMVNSEWAMYAIFAICCAAMGLFVYLFLPETKGKSLEEMDLIFGGDLKDGDLGLHHPATAAETIRHVQHLAPLSDRPINRVLPDSMSDDLRL